MTGETETRRVPIERLSCFIEQALTAVGMPDGDARTVAALMTEADALGAEGHGIFRLPQYVRRIKAGGLNLHPNIRIERERAGMALLDGDNAMGHLVMHRAAVLASEKAAAAGVCRSEIESRTGESVRAFAYPYGDFDQDVRDQVAGHFLIACTTVLDYAGTSDPLALPRLDIYYLQKLFWFNRLGTALGRQYIAARRHIRQFRRTSPVAAYGTGTD
jgi:hypothetical protein